MSFHEILSLLSDFLPKFTAHIFSNVFIAGSFAVITLMTGKVVLMYQDRMPGKSVPEHITVNTSNSLLEDIRGDPTVQVASVVSLTVGAFQACQSFNRPKEIHT